MSPRNKRTALLAVVIIALLSAIVVITPAAATTWYVDDDGGADFTTIQDAVTAASPGDTIFVLNGTYSGQPGSDFAINKPYLRIIGEGADAVTFDGGPIVGVRIPDDGGNATGTVVEGIKFVKLYQGPVVGMFGPAQDSVIRACTFDGSSGAVHIRSQNVTFEDNVLSNITAGYALVVGNPTIFADYAKICHNSFVNISGHGLGFCSREGLIANNTFDRIAGDALALYGARATNNTITGNSFISNAGVVRFENSGNDNRIFLNNMVNNTNLVTISGVAPNTTYWTSPGPIDYTFNGNAHSGVLGNYWDTYTGADADQNGIGDTAFQVDALLGNDTAPLMGAWQDGVIMDGPVGPTTWYVDDSGGADFTTIQAAVSAAGEGDTIIVKDGSYTESVVVSTGKVGLTIRSENGAATTTVTGPFAPPYTVFRVEQDFITIQGFSVRAAGGSTFGIDYSAGADYGTIVQNDVVGCYFGINLGGGSNHFVAGNEIANCSQDGIRIGSAATNNTVTRNYCHNNTKKGISLRDTATGNFVTENTCENNGEDELCIKDTTYGNVIWLNNFMGSVECLTNNTYHSPTQLNYTYNGSTYTNYLGNYYSGYAGADADGDGIGDTPYSFGTYGDEYPLMAPFEEYFGEPGLCGDVNNDDRVTMGDGRLIYLNVIYGAEAYPLANPSAADVNGDGRITMGDGRLVYLNVIYGDEEYPLECGS